MNPATTVSGWAFGSATPVPLSAAPPALLPRRQVPLIGNTFLPHQQIRPRELFPSGPSGVRLNSAQRLHAVMDPNAPAPPVHMIPAQQPAPAAAPPPAAAAAAPPPPVEHDEAIAMALQSRIAYLENIVQAQAAQSQSQYQAAQAAQAQAFAAAAAQGGGSGANLSHFLVPASLSGPSSGSLGTSPLRPDPPPSLIRGVAPKLPVPESIKEGTIKKYQGDPDALTIMLERIFDYICRTGLQYPLDIQAFVTDLALSKWIRSYLEKAMSAAATANAPFDQNAFTSALVAFVTGEVRPRSVIALHELMEGRITQGSQSAAQYSEHFYTRSRLLSHIPPAVLCHHYIAGLRPDLRKLCCVDREGKDWTSLHTLVAFTIVEERRLTMTSDLAHSHHDDTSRKRSQFWRKQADDFTPVGKRSRLAAAMEIDHPPPPPPSTYAAAVAQQRASQNGGRPSRGSPPSRSGPSAAAPAPNSSGAGPSRSGPPEACPCYKLNNKNRKLEKWEQECLTAYGLCWYCKASTEHSAKDCPYKNRRQEGPQ